MRPEDALRLRIKDGFVAARAAHAAGDGAARLAALEDTHQAAVAVGDPSLLAPACWRLAKARYDQGVNDGLVDAVRPLLDETLRERSMWGVREAVGPFDLHETSLSALEPISRRHWDHVGYADSDLLRLWDAWIARREVRGEPFLAAWGHVQRAWQQACRGDVRDVHQTALAHARLTPHAFEGATTAHGRAPDAPHSVFWVQLDLARSLLRTATWAGAERVAWEARELLEDAAEDAELVRSQDFWFLDAVLRAADRFGWSDAAAYEPAYAAWAASASLPEPHALRARARVASDPAAHRRAAQAVLDAHAGFEWAVEALALAGDHEAGRALAAGHGVVWAPA